MGGKKYLEGTKIEDLRGRKFNRLIVIDFDWNRYEKDLQRRLTGELKQITYYWICKCECGKILSVNSSGIKSGKTKSCGCYKNEMFDNERKRIKKQSFYDWCVEHGKQKYLSLWDYEKNKADPKYVSYGSSVKYWFKCDKGIHDSELKSISNLTQLRGDGRLNSVLSCKKCNSFGQYLLDTYGSLDMWSDNKLNPFELGRGSNTKVELVCSSCGSKNTISCGSFSRRKSMGCKCGDGKSYPEKFVFSMLKQIGVDFESEYSPSWAIIDFKKTKRKCRYDFYIPSKNLIIETDGGFHYRDNNMSGLTVEESICIDRLKDEAAFANGNIIIRIDCSTSEHEYIKRNISNSELSNIFNLNKIDWDACEEFALSNMVRSVCSMWTERKFHNTKSLADYIGIDRTTVNDYLKRGKKLGWCEYDPKKEMKSSWFKKGILKGKQVEMFKDGVSMGVFECSSKLQKDSESLFGVKLLASKISSVCTGKRNHHKGFTFRYIESEENNTYIAS